MPRIARLRDLFRKRQFARELEEELEFHLEMRRQWNIEHGMPAAEAGRAARIRFGNPSLWCERIREIDLMLLPQTIWQDLRYGTRMVRRNAGFTIAAVLALALGIGVNTTIITAYKAFFALPLDAKDPNNMVNLALNLQSGSISPYFSYADFRAYQDGLHSLNGVIAHSHLEQLTMVAKDGIARERDSGIGALVERAGGLPVSVGYAQSVGAEMVSENYFTVLGVSMLRGRAFRAEDITELSAFPSVLISENYWRKAFGGDPSLLGKSIRLNGAAFTVIGITPHNFVGTIGFAVPDLWLPLSLEPLLHTDDELLHNREEQCCRLFARLVPGITIPQAQSEMTLLAEHLRTLHNSQFDLAKSAKAFIWPGSPYPVPLKQYGGLRFAILLILAAGGMVLLIACANVASLQLARTSSRRNELSMRLSLGASRSRLIRQLLTESALLGIVAGAVALLFSWLFLKGLAALLGAMVPQEYGTLVYNMTPDLGVFVYVFAISVVAGILFGIVPALESSSAALSSSLKGNMGSSPRRIRLIRECLIAAQVSLALALMIAGSLLIRSSLHVLQEDPGYKMNQIIALDIQFPKGAEYTSDHKVNVARELCNRLAALAGVTASTSANSPLVPNRNAAVVLDGASSSVAGTQVLVGFDYVQTNYFQTLGIPLLSGHSFEAHGGQSDDSLVVSRTAAERLWQGRNPIGLSLRLSTKGQFLPKNELVPDGRSLHVVGVVGDTLGSGQERKDGGTIYLPLPDEGLAEYPILVRTDGDAEQLMDALASVISSTDPNLIAHASTVARMFRTTPTFMIPSTSAAIASAVGTIGLLLASLGIYGTVSYVVVLRTREIGIRLALGAQKSNILSLMLRETIRPVFAGLLLGTCFAVGVSHLLRQILFELNSVDGVSFGVTSALFLAIALFAAYMPSRRAMRVDPVGALRAE
jgi:predicted permease